MTKRDGWQGNNPIFETNQQAAALLRRLASLEEKVEELDRNVIRVQDDVSKIVPAMVNLANNSDFLFSDEHYNAHSYVNDQDVLAQWYQSNINTSPLITENAPSAASPYAIYRNLLLDPNAQVDWKDETNTLLWGGQQRLMTPLDQNYALPGRVLYVKFNFRPSNVNFAPPQGTGFRVAIYDNTSGQQKIVTGQPRPVPVATKIGSHPGGTHTRRYRIRFRTATQDFFSSASIAGTAAEVTNTVNPDNVDTENYIALSWEGVVGVLEYRVERAFQSGGVWFWFVIAVIKNGATTYLDKGGTVLSSALPDNLAIYEQAVTGIHVADLLADPATRGDWRTAMFGISIPDNYDMSLTTGKQYLIFLPFTNNNTPIGLYWEIDLVGLSYVNGGWTPSPRDMTIPSPLLSANTDQNMAATGSDTVGDKFLLPHQAEVVKREY
jgi:hypothetical protein